VSAPAAPGPCPRCGADEPRPVVYGFPVPSVLDLLEDDEPAPRRDDRPAPKEVVRPVHAGCDIPPDPRAWACGRCGLHYGERLRFGADEDG